MSYSTNPRLPKLRANAANMVLSGKSISEVARYFGYSKSAVCKWVKKAPSNIGVSYIATMSSRPHHHPSELSKDTISKIISYKKKYNRCSDVIHQHLLNDGIRVSLNSVKRKLDQAGLINKRSKWKRYHKSEERPLVQKPGDLLMVDTIHFMVGSRARIYVYTLIDVYSRWCYALAMDKINTRQSIKFINKAQNKADFKFECIQSDHGSEFSQHFSERIKIRHRHSRIRKPNDNSYIERFNRTLQTECLRNVAIDSKSFNKALTKYLAYYNTERLHMGIDFKTPIALVKCFQAIG